METIFDFTLPIGYMDENGKLHRNGKMRLATATDEINALKNPRARREPDYCKIALLSQVITHLEGIEMITPDILEKMFTADISFLQELYQKINDIEIPTIPVECPCCGCHFKAPLKFTQE